MPSKLSAADAKAAFDELAKELPKQHLRLQFRKRFGTGELLPPDMLKRATSVVTRDKPLTNLLQEVPEILHCTRILGTVDAPRADGWTTAPGGPIGDLLSPEEVEQGLIIQGRKARLYAYADPTEDLVYVLRVTTEAFGEEEAAPAPKPKTRSRTQRAAASGKAVAKRGRSTSRKSAPKGRGRR